MNNHYRIKRYVFFWAMMLFKLGVPVAVITDEYKLVYFREYTKTKTTIAFAIVAAVFVVTFLRHFIKWISTWQPSLGKSFIDITIHSLPLGIVSLLFEAFRRNTGNLAQVWWVLASSVFISILVKQGHDYYLIHDIKTREIKHYGKGVR